MSVIVTQCDVHYLSRTIALIQSLVKTSGTRQMWVYAHDEESKKALEELPYEHIKVITSQFLTSQFKELQECSLRKNRMEFLFAMTPYMILYALEFTNSQVWYVDADVYFYRNFSILENQTTNKSILVSAHNFPSRLKSLEKYGKYNVGIIYVSGDKESLKAIEWWANKCIEDTSFFAREEVYGDQKYLDEFPKICSHFGVFEPLEICIAPWNVENCENFPPATFHFSGLRRYKRFSFMGLSTYGVRGKGKYRKILYRPYNKSLDEIEIEIFGGLKIDSRKMSRRSLLRMIHFLDFLPRCSDGNRLKIE